MEEALSIWLAADKYEYVDVVHVEIAADVAAEVMREEACFDAQGCHDRWRMHLHAANDPK